MQTQERPLGQRIWIGFVRFVGTLFVVALLGLVAYLASERNARRYSFQQAGDQLVVMKGRMLPTGAEPWQPGDPGMADVYSPVPLDGTEVDATLLERRFEDRDELDQALFGVLETLARPRVQSDDPKRLERGVYYLRRAERLTGISSEQKHVLEALRADVALYLARLKLDEVRALLAEALTQLQLASTGQNRNAARARELVSEIAVPAREFEAAVARVLGGLPLAPVELPAQQPPSGEEPSEEPAPPAEPPAEGEEAASEEPGAVKTDSQVMERPEEPVIPKGEVSDGP